MMINIMFSLLSPGTNSDPASPASPSMCQGYRFEIILTKHKQIKTEFNDKCQRCLPARTQSLLASTTSLAAQALHRGHYHHCFYFQRSLSSTKVVIMIFSRPNFHPYQNTMIKADTDQSSRQLAQVSLAMVRHSWFHLMTIMKMIMTHDDNENHKNYISEFVRAAYNLQLFE